MVKYFILIAILLIILTASVVYIVMTVPILKFF